MYDFIFIPCTSIVSLWQISFCIYTSELYPIKNDLHKDIISFELLRAESAMSFCFLEIS